MSLPDAGERELLPHQEATLKAGLEKAVQHKDKLLEFDRNRYLKTHCCSEMSRFTAVNTCHLVQTYLF